jgi:ubiquitin C-terminal hydrolase
MQIPSASLNPLPQKDGAIDLNQQKGVPENPNPPPQESVPANPNPQPPIEAAEDPKIQPANNKSPWDKFSSYIEPFIQLLSGMFAKGIDFADRIVDRSDELITAVQIVFSRLIFSPVFDPDKKAFKQLVEGFETQIPELKKQMENLEGRFFEVAMILRDLQEVEEFYKKVQTTINQLDELVPLAAMRPRTAPVHEQLVKLRNEYGALNQALNDYMRHKTPKIMDPFKEMIDKFLETGIAVPNEIRQDLNKSWRIIETLMRNRVPRYKLLDLQRQMRLLNQDVADDKVIVGRTQPLKLRNIGNSCYIDSVLQALLCEEAICEKICQPLVRGNLSIEEFRKKMAIQQELVKFIEAQQGNRAKGPFSQMEFVLQLLKGPSLHDFRDAVFNSRIHMEFKRDNLYRQLDAATFMEFLFDQFLDCGFKYIEHAKIPEFPGLEYVKRPEPMNILQIPFLTDRNGKKYKKIENLITLSLRPHNVHEDNPDDQRRFNPQEMKVINAEEASRVPKDVGEVKVKDYMHFHKLDELPDVLTLHFKRFVNVRVPGSAVPDLRKVNDPVELPAAKNGIIDLSKHCETPDGKPLAYPVNYEIISYVVHSGSLHGGHYISYVKKGGKYWKCDDLDRNGYQEITKEDFFLGKEEYRNKDGAIIDHPLNDALHPYLVVLKRLPEEQQKPAPIHVEKNQQPKAIPAQPPVQRPAPPPV